MGGMCKIIYASNVLYHAANHGLFQKRVYRAIVYLLPEQFQASPKDLSNNMLKVHKSNRF